MNINNGVLLDYLNSTNKDKNYTYTDILDIVISGGYMFVTTNKEFSGTRQDLVSISTYRDYVIKQRGKKIEKILDRKNYI